MFQNRACICLPVFISAVFFQCLFHQIPVGFIVLNAGVDRDKEEIVQEVVQMVRKRIGPVAAFKKATVVKRLPKTRSGKILRGTIQKIADNKPYKAPATIDDPAILGEMEEALIGTPIADPKRPLEVLRTVHSFDPCIACGVHVIDPDSNEVYKVRVL